MSERTPLPKLGENAKDFSEQTKTLGEIEDGQEIERKDEFYHEVADDYIAKYAGEVADEDKERLSASVAAEVEKVFRSEQYGTKEQQVKALEKLIADLQAGAATTTPEAPAQSEPTAPEQGESRGEQGPRPQGVPTTAEVQRGAQDLEQNKHKYSMWQKARMAVGLPMLAAATLFAKQEAQRNKFIHQPGETDEEYKKRTRKAMIWSVPIWAAAGFLAPKVLRGAEAAWDGIFDGTGTGVANAEPKGPLEGDLDGDGTLNGRETSLLHGFGYNWNEDPFNDTEKKGPHNFGNELGAHVNGPEKAVGLDDLTENRWKDSPEQFATAAAEMGLDGFKTDNIEEMAEKLKTDPEFFEANHKKLMDILNNPETKFSIGTLEPGTYGSYYETAVDQNGIISYDNNIGEPGTTIKIEYKDAQGNWQTIEFKRECGGQVIHRSPVEYAQPVGQGGYSAAPATYGGQGGGEYIPPAPNGEGGTPPSPETPETPDTPEEPETPETPEEPETPEVPETPETPNPKSTNPDDYEHDPVAPPAVFDGWAPPAQTEPSPDSVTDTTPSTELSDTDLGGQADGSETPTEEEQQQQQEQAPASGAADDGDDTPSPWGN